MIAAPRGSGDHPIDESIAIKIGRGNKNVRMASRACWSVVDFMPREQPRHSVIATSRQRHQSAPYCLQKWDPIVNADPSVLRQFEDDQVAPAIADRLHQSETQIPPIAEDQRAGSRLY